MALSRYFFLLVKVLKDDVAKHKALFQASENTGQKLIERSQEDPAVVAEVYSKLYKVRTALDKLSARADQRFSRLQHVLLQSQELQVSFDEFLEKLDRLEGSIALQAPVSGVCDTVKEQNQQQQVSFGIKCCLYGHHDSEGLSTRANCTELDNFVQHNKYSRACAKNLFLDVENM